MAGRGRAATLPAWMQKQQQQQAAIPQARAPPTAAIPSGVAGQYEDAPSLGTYADGTPKQRPSREEPVPISSRASEYPSNPDSYHRRKRSRSRSSGQRRGSGGGGGGYPHHQSSRQRPRSRSHSRSYTSSSRYRGRSSRHHHHSPSEEEPHRGPTRVPRRERNAKKNFDVYPPGVTEENVDEFRAQAILQHNMAALQGAVGAASFGHPIPGSDVGSGGRGGGGRHGPHGSHGGGSEDPNDAGATTRHARRIYVGGIDDVPEEEVKDFFNSVIAKGLGNNNSNAHIPAPGDDGSHVVSCYLNRDRHFAFVEFASVEIASACMKLDGISFRGNPVKIRRPNDYNPAAVLPVPASVPEFDLEKLGIISTSVTDGPGKLFIGGIPYHLTEDQIKELLQAFGPLRAFHLVRDPTTSISKGYAFCEYVDSAVTAKAVEGLNDLQLGDKALSVRSALPPNSGGGDHHGGMMQTSTIGSVELAEKLGINAEQAALEAMSMAGVGLPLPPDAEATRILILKNMVTHEELQDHEEYDDIVQDIKSECQNYGQVLSITVPRPDDKVAASAIGKVFVEFDSVESTKSAAHELHGRGFANRTVECDYLSEANYASKTF